MKYTKLLCVGLLSLACSLSACSTQSINESVTADNVIGTVVIHGNQVYDYSSVQTTLDNAAVVVKERFQILPRVNFALTEYSHMARLKSMCNKHLKAILTKKTLNFLLLVARYQQRAIRKNC